MKQSRIDGLVLVLLGCVVLLCVSSYWERTSPESMQDFKLLYFGTKCAIQHCDPYNQSEIAQVYDAGAQGHFSDPAAIRRMITIYVNLPTGFTFLFPFAILPWGPAHILWLFLTAGSLMLAAFLMWDVGAEYSPVLSGWLVCLILVGDEFPLEVGNASGIVVGLCGLAVWCFLRERFVMLGVFCLAASLTIKPHDAGFIWLFLLLAGGVYRKRALQTLAVTAALALPAVLWVSHVAPHWRQEMLANLSIISARGSFYDPGPIGVNPLFRGSNVISLQSVVSVFKDDPHFYNLISYSVCGVLLLLWAFTTLRSRPVPNRIYLGLAAIAALSMLPIYHRQYDAGLLLLAVPACAMLWAERGPIARIAMLLTGAGAVLMEVLWLRILAGSTVNLRAGMRGLSGHIVTVLLCRPFPLILLAMGSFYLWIYVKRTFKGGASHA